MDVLFRREAAELVDRALSHQRILSAHPPPHLRRDWARPCHICTRTWLTPCLICTGTWLTPATSALGLGSPPPHLRRDWARTVQVVEAFKARPLPRRHELEVVEDDVLHVVHVHLSADPAGSRAWPPRWLVGCLVASSSCLFVCLFVRSCVCLCGDCLLRLLTK